MIAGRFITGTGTDVGKTYVTALLAKAMTEAGMQTAYYKAALSGAENIEDSDGGYVHRIGHLTQEPDTLITERYVTAVSPHLAARLEGHPLQMADVKRDFGSLADRYDYLLAEGSGGIICPIRCDEEETIFLEDIIRALGLPSILVTDARLGTINATVLTAEYMRGRRLPLTGIIVNRYHGGVMEEDNVAMMETLTGLPVLCVVPEGAESLPVPAEALLDWFGGK